MIHIIGFSWQVFDTAKGLHTTFAAVGLTCLLPSSSYADQTNLQDFTFIFLWPGWAALCVSLCRPPSADLETLLQPVTKLLSDGFTEFSVDQGTELLPLKLTILMIVRTEIWFCVKWGHPHCGHSVVLFMSLSILSRLGCLIVNIGSNIKYETF